MKPIIASIKPILFALLTTKAVKDLVIELLRKYVKTTDNQIDDALVEIVEDKLFTPEK